MTNEEYRELNDYLNDIFLELEKENFFFIDNIEVIDYLNSRYCELVGQYELKDTPKEKYLTYEEVYQLAREVIESINSNYLKEFDELIEKGLLDFDYENVYKDSHVYYKISEEESIKLINIKRTYNYEEVKTLVHEFIHYTNSDIHTVRKHVLAEYLSICGELYAEDYMIDKGISLDEVNSIKRIKTTYLRCSEFSWIMDALIVYKQFGSLTPESIDFATKYNEDLDKEELELQCKRILKSIREYNKNQNSIPEEDREELYWKIEFFYMYLIGTIFGFYTKEHIDKKTFSNMNDHINDKNGLSPLDVLYNTGIDIYKDGFEDEMFEIIESYLNKFKKKVIK